MDRKDRKLSCVKSNTFFLPFYPPFSTKLLALMSLFRTLLPYMCESRKQNNNSHLANTTKQWQRSQSQIGRERDSTDSPIISLLTQPLPPYYPQHTQPFLSLPYWIQYQRPQGLCLLTKLNTCKKGRARKESMKSVGGGARYEETTFSSLDIFHSCQEKKAWSSSYFHIMSRVCSCCQCASMLKNVSS